MANIGMNFDATVVPEREDYSPLPPGRYTGMIVASEMKQSKKGGGYLEFAIDVMDGEYVGKKVYDRLNLQNANETTVKIAQQTLAEICKAVNTPKISDSNQLHAKRFLFDVEVEMGSAYVDNNGIHREAKPQNKIKKYHPYVAGVQGQVTQGTAQQGAAPWKTK